MANLQEQRKVEFIEQMLNEVHAIPINEVVGSVVPLVQRGRHYMGLCPFHPDHRLGSFVVTPDKNIWQCFAEGIGGGPEKFYMEYYHIGYLQAAFRLAREYHIISEKDYQQYSNKRYNKETVEVIRNKIEEPMKMEFRRASYETITAVYSVIPSICKLSDAHTEHLRKVRYLTDLSDYFTVPTRRMDLPGRIINSIRDRIETEVEADPSIPDNLKLNEVEKRIAVIEDELPYVPGFFYNNSAQKVDFVSYKGIGILCRDADGKPVGIQVRRDTVKEGEQRYIWFSSTFAQKDGSGASSGSPGGYIPCGKTKASICITEGRFKAEKIAEKGNDAVYVSGVSTWKSVLPILKKIRKGRDTVYLMFDSDMMGNIAVHKQLVAFENELEKNHFQTRIVLWKIEDGKGFDDLVINKGSHYKDCMKGVSYQAFSRIYEMVLQEVLKSFEVSSPREIKPEDADLFNQRMQRMVEKEIGLK